MNNIMDDLNFLTGLMIGLTSGFILGVNMTELRLSNSHRTEDIALNETKLEDFRILAEGIVLRLSWEHPSVKALPEYLLYEGLVDVALRESDIDRDANNPDEAYLTPCQTETFLENFEVAVLMKLYR